MPKRSGCNQVRLRLYGLIILLVLLGFMTEAGIAADKSSDPDGDKAANRIHIISDKLITDTKAKTAEFIGNVRATQGDTVIIADRLKIYYQKAPREKGGGAGEESIKKIIASGNVTIQMDDKVAVTEQAVYITKTEVLVLTGTNSKITSDNNSASGDRITLYRADNHMIVDSSSEERVEAILYTKDKGLK